jgi:putative flippase GtrA
LIYRVILSTRDNPLFRRLSAVVAAFPFVGRLWQGLWESPRRIERFTKFAIVGTIGAVVDFTVLNVMKLLFENIGLGSGWDLSVEVDDIQLAAANAISFSAAVLSNFTWNRLWTFPESRERPLGVQLVQFTAVNVLGLVINTAIVLIMNRYVFQLFLSERLSYNLAKAIAIIVVLFWNFGVNLLWTYRGIEVGAGSTGRTTADTDKRCTE